MLLPSPMKHIFSPSSLALRSRMVMRSASTWQGWAKSVRPTVQTPSSSLSHSWDLV